MRVQPLPPASSQLRPSRPSSPLLHRPIAAEEELLRTEAEALSRELAEVKEARRVLHAVRGEAAQAIQAVR
jgi:hypothetical protein